MSSRAPDAGSASTRVRSARSRWSTGHDGRRLGRRRRTGRTRGGADGGRAWMRDPARRARFRHRAARAVRRGRRVQGARRISRSTQWGRAVGVTTHHAGRVSIAERIGRPGRARRHRVRARPVPVRTGAGRAGDGGGCDDSRRHRGLRAFAGRRHLGGAGQRIPHSRSRCYRSRWRREHGGTLGGHRHTGPREGHGILRTGPAR